MENATQEPSVLRIKIAQSTKSISIFDPGALVLILVNLLFLGGLICIAFLYYQGNAQLKLEEISPTNQSPASLEIPQTVQEPDLNLYTVNVLNGSGKSGAASKVVNLLKEAGFQKVDKGDASKSTYQETEVSLKKEVPETVTSKIQESLKDYTLKFLEPLEETEEYDIKIIVGSK